MIRKYLQRKVCIWYVTKLYCVHVQFGPVACAGRNRKRPVLVDAGGPYPRHLYPHLQWVGWTDAADLPATFLPDGKLGRGRVMAWYCPLIPAPQWDAVEWAGQQWRETRQTIVPFTWLHLIRRCVAVQSSSLNVSLFFSLQNPPNKERKKDMFAIFWYPSWPPAADSSTTPRSVTMEIPSSRKELCPQCLPVEKSFWAWKKKDGSHGSLLLNKEAVMTLKYIQPDLTHTVIKLECWSQRAGVRIQQQFVKISQRIRVSRSFWSKIPKQTQDNKKIN